MISPGKRIFIASVFTSIGLIASRHDCVLAFSLEKPARYRSSSPLTQKTDDTIECSSDNISNVITTDRREILKSAIVTATTLVAADRPAFAAPELQPAVCDPEVLVLSKGNRIVHMVGTTHISTVSADLARQLVRETKPGAIFVELDMKRVSRGFKSKKMTPEPGLTFGYPDAEGNLKIAPLAEALKDAPKDPAAMAVINKVVDKVRYQDLDNMGLKESVGSEFTEAMGQGLDQGATILLGDRDVDVTMKRIAQAFLSTGPTRLLHAQDKIDAAMVSEMVRKGAIITPEKQAKYDAQGGMTKEDYLNDYIEKMKGRDTTEVLMKTMKKEAPQVYEVLVAERDSYMANNIDKWNQFESIVAVMGEGHLAGVSDNLIQLGWEFSSKPCDGI